MSNPKKSCSHPHVHACRWLCAPLLQLLGRGKAPLYWEGGSPPCTPLLWETWVLHLYVTACCSLRPAGPPLVEKTPGRSPTPWGWVPPAWCTLYWQPASWMRPPPYACPRQKWWCWWGNVVLACGSCCLRENTLTGNFSYPKIVACTWTPSWLSSCWFVWGAWTDYNIDLPTPLQEQMSVWARCPAASPEQMDVRLLPSPEARRSQERGKKRSCVWAQQPHIPWHGSRVPPCPELQSGCSVSPWWAGLFAVLHRLCVGQQLLRSHLSSAHLARVAIAVGTTLLELFSQLWPDMNRSVEGESTALWFSFFKRNLSI